MNQNLPWIYIANLTRNGGQAEKNEIFHLKKVLRCRMPFKVMATNGCGLLAKGIISENGNFELHTFKKLDLLNEGILLQATPKRFAQEQIFQKSVEFSLKKVIFFSSDHAHSNPKPKIERLKAIGVAAAKQSQNVYLPEIEIFEGDFNRLLSNYPAVIWGDWNSKMKNLSPIGAFINGPEGGWSKREKDLLFNYSCVSFSPTILRVETAATAAMVLMKRLT